MVNETTISVIIPCYNVEQFLEKTVLCLDTQTYQNFEVILINDGSSDRTEEIAKQLVNQRKNYQLHSYKNEGVSAARNHGMEFAKGDYIYFLDADDCFLPNMFEDLVRLIESYGSPDVLFFGFEWVWNVDELPIIENPTLSAVEYTGMDIIEHFSLPAIGFSDEDVYTYYKTGKWVWKPISTVWRHLYKKELLKNNKITYVNGLALVEDRIFNLTVYAYAKNVVETKNKYYYYFQDGGLLRNITKNAHRLYKGKTNALKQRERVRQLYLELHDFDMKNYYCGTNVCGCLQLGVSLVNLSLREGLSLYKEFLSNKEVQESLHSLSTKGAPLKFKIPVMLLKFNMPTMLFVLLWLANKMGIKAKM